jgi:hypothetical protein
MSMSEMIKRVAQAIKSGMTDSGVVSLVANGPRGELALRQFFEDLAVVAIEAMREPTDAMFEAAATVDRYAEPGEEWGPMIDAALTL